MMSAPARIRPARRTHGAAIVAVIVALVILELVIVGMVLSGSRDHIQTVRQVEAVEAYYAAEAGLNMAIRELLADLDEDGDCGVGSISHDGDNGTDPAFGPAAFVVTTSGSGTQKTLESYGRSGSTRRQMLTVVNIVGGTLFSDDFDDDTITGWSSIGSDSMRETGGVFTTQSGSNTSAHYTIDAGTSWTDYTVSVDVKSVDDDVMGISFRVQDSDNYYVFRQKFGDSGSWDLEIEKYTGGSASNVGSVIDNFGSSAGQIDDANAWYTLKVVVSGSNMKCYVDDVLKFDENDSSYSTGTAGLWTWAETDCEFNDMLVE